MYVCNYKNYSILWKNNPINHKIKRLMKVGNVLNISSKYDK